MYYDGLNGIVTVISGPMFSEKSGELIKRCLKMQKYQHKKVIAFKPLIDNRFSETKIVSRIGLSMEANIINQNITEDVYQDILIKTQLCDVVAFDEVQFFSKEIVNLVNKLAYMNKYVILSGLNLNFRGETFGPMGDLLARADEIINLKAICSCCGRPASFTQRLIGEKPTGNGPIELIGDKESYEARCGLCFVPPYKINI